MNSNFKDNSKTTRRGFTLVELLFVIAIIAVLGTMAAGILGKAQKDAQIAATRARITSIEAIMQTVSEEFEVRRLPFRNSALKNFVNENRFQRTRVRNLRRRILAALMQAEFPGPQVDSNGNFVASPDVTGKILPPANAPPVLGWEGLGNFRTWIDSGPAGLKDGFSDWLENNVPPSAEMRYWQNVSGLVDNTGGTIDQPGEYLYLILERIDIDGVSALESLGPRVIGNTDNDTFPEIVDAFGNSMQLRIVQVAVDKSSGVPGDDNWVDFPDSQINWKQSTIVPGTTVKLPNGYDILNPLVHRPTSKIRFQVVSPTLEAIE